ncbi:MAG: exonuclease/endonuclease/phosphatase family protein [Candidatus Cryosericum sp.]
MRLRIASWNVRGMPRPADQLRLLADMHPEILLAQDVGPSAVRAVTESHLWLNLVQTWSLPHRPGATIRRGGCLIAADADWVLTPALPSPDELLSNRSLAVTASRGQAALTLLSCYAPTNAGPSRKLRPAYFAALAAWLRAVPAPLVLGMDANGPRVDHPDIDQSKWWTQEETLVLGAGTPTEDVLRLWYADHPAELKRRLRYYPSGPLADSYHRGRKGKYLRCRYDSIRVSPGIHVLDVRYLYDDAVRAGSDHALVIADIELP